MNPTITGKKTGINSNMGFFFFRNFILRVDFLYVFQGINSLFNSLKYQEGRYAPTHAL